MNITISRQSATNGLFIAQLVAERLGMRIFDGALVDEIARRAQVDPTILQHYDEQAVNPVASMLWEWRSSISPETYTRHVRDSIRAFAREGNAIIVGRGANYILRGPDTLHVRMIAPLELRVAMYCAGENVSERDAQRWIHDQDILRAEFIHKYFRKSIDDPSYYDLIINLSGLSLEAVADIIVEAAKKRCEEKLTEEKALPKYKELLARRHPVSRPLVVQPSRPRC